jgi:GAF domain
MRRALHGLTYDVTMASTGNQRAAAKAGKANIGELESLISESPSSDRACLKLSQILNVRPTEVALMRIDKGSLRFIYPPELRSAGVLPLSGSAVAARTVSTRTPLLSNTFMRVKHVALFEAVKLGAEVQDRSMEQMPIQKIMSVPVAVSEGNVMGVVQVSRKGLDPAVAGVDFTNEDLKQLEQMAEILARMPFMKEGAEF